MNWPNVLTVSRLFFALIIVFLMSLNTLGSYVFAAFFFFIASMTDFFDGYLAKRYNLISNFGKIMDPIADKVLILAIFFQCVHLGMVTFWIIALIALREVLVTLSRLEQMTKGRVLAAEKLGKIKTVCQIVTICVIFLYLICEQALFAKDWFYRIEGGWRGMIQVLTGLTLLITLYSGIDYFKELCKTQRTK